ncbi:hypothetical protein CLV58_10626 [Spirosoma oryzae]|uniref:Excisionase family DNA binding protein n=1 Tax=Spirosoma oryzae TaxID=1469603 RepID=A0A2T0T5C7_9BACT|nr:helix-turn-helix domain-containing protein [Spirosoma oryzae]PRY40843.1 hypothetical protein CLV58_10626 [Spirosoma oryzae]
MVILAGDQLRELIASEVTAATAPLIAQLEAVERKLATPRLRYNTQEVAAMYGIRARSVRDWIRNGRIDKNGTTHFLKASELTHGRYSISLESVHTFLSFFE